MTGGEVALDTNQAIAVLNGTDGAGEWVQGFGRVCLPVPVVGELLFGALRSGRSEENLARVDRLVSRCEALPAGAATAGVYARLRMALRQQGTPIPENDLWIAAICCEHRVPLATSDGHFGSVPELTVCRR